MILAISNFAFVLLCQLPPSLLKNAFYMGCMLQPSTWLNHHSKNLNTYCHAHIDISILVRHHFVSC